ncbi:LysM peptidoglycan-binding domain-containing protein [Arthrobacter sp. 2MCAF15]|uniref:LysM peptidoglycan-binding domain-containing protein n=1 Tax=Arthrobacter sp. 2MCAF15 TaxID=3232984 RepID=UPI003F8FE2B4
MAAFLALQPAARVTEAAATQSPSATSVEPTKDPPDPGSSAAAVTTTTAEAVPEKVKPPAADNTGSVPAAAAAVVEPAPAAVPEGAGAGATATNAYVVVAGDTVSAIANRFGVDAYQMLAANGLGVYTLIFPGQTLKLSGPPVSVPAAPPARRAPAEAAAAAPGVRTIHIAGAGGQSMVDRCIGPIHFTPTDAFSLFITEHDWCGGWARFSGIGVGETVNIPGFGTYKATGRGRVPQGGNTNDVSAVFGGFPRAILQTCIPGTNQMLLIALN